MLIDANLLLYAVDEDARQHEVARAWLEDALNGPRRVGLPWQSLLAFVRIVTHPRALATPLDGVTAWGFVEDWLDAPAAWLPTPGRGFRAILARLVADLDIRGNVIPDAALAALALEHGVPVASADADFARFPGLVWVDPLRA